MKLTLAMAALVAVVSAADGFLPKHDECKDKDTLKCSIKCLKTAATGIKCSGDALKSVCHHIDDSKPLKGCLSKCGVSGAITGKLPGQDLGLQAD